MVKTADRNTGQVLTDIIKAYRVVHEKHEKKRFQGRHRQNVFSLMPVLSIVEGGAFESRQGVVASFETSRLFTRCQLDLPGKTTAMDGGRDCSRQSSAFPPSMEVRSAGVAGSGSSKNLEGLPIGLFPVL